MFLGKITEHLHFHSYNLDLPFCLFDSLEYSFYKFGDLFYLLLFYNEPPNQPLIVKFIHDLKRSFLTTSLS